ncbi:MAG TPA: hypothetical protein VLE02_00870 [Nitrosarchaeum sp.]|nr:hypothetical protein [Nitrosarchaeum sp.]
MPVKKKVPEKTVKKSSNEKQVLTPNNVLAWSATDRKNVAMTVGGVYKFLDKGGNTRYRLVGTPTAPTSKGTKPKLSRFASKDDAEHLAKKLNLTIKNEPQKAATAKKEPAKKAAKKSAKKAEPKKKAAKEDEDDEEEEDSEDKNEPKKKAKKVVKKELKVSKEEEDSEDKNEPKKKAKKVVKKVSKEEEDSEDSDKKPVADDDEDSEEPKKKAKKDTKKPQKEDVESEEVSDDGDSSLDEVDADK